MLALLVARKQQNNSVQQAALRRICDKTKKQIIMTIFENEDFYLIVKNDRFIKEDGKWSKDIRKALTFDSKKLAMTFIKNKRLRTGRLAAYVFRCKVTKGRTETESIIKTL